MKDPSDRASVIDAIFDRAGELIAAGWSREHFTTNEAGEARPFDATDATRFTSAHALQRAAWEVVGTGYEADWYVCVHFSEEAMREAGWTAASVPVWSDLDAAARSESDVSAIFDTAKELARESAYAIPQASRLYPFWTAAAFR